MSLNHLVKTEKLNLKTVYENNIKFIIPSYQRPYVWSDDDVLMLFNDIKAACILKEENYFVGTTLTSKKKSDNQNIYELIDGQQRTTTLMLICIAFKKAEIKTELVNLVTYIGKNNKAEPRIDFEIREQVQNLLGFFAGIEGYSNPLEKLTQDDSYLKQIDIALNVLVKEIKKLKTDLTLQPESLAQYIYSQVKWVNNIVPDKMDLNRIFTSMNTTGIQLEQTDLLKAYLLKQVKTDKQKYEAMWLACEHLENYFEKNVRKIFNVNWNHITPEDLSFFNDSKFTIVSDAPENTDEQKKGLLLKEIEILSYEVNNDKGLDLTNTEKNKVNNKNSDKDDSLDLEITYCRSIIKFPLLLIHTYRIFLATENQQDILPRLHSDKLLEIFTPLIKSDENLIKKFISLLWRVRYQFDKWVIKWTDDDNSNKKISQLNLTNQSISKTDNNTYINRSKKALNALVLLQSVRYFTGERSAQYWLTPFLAHLVDNPKCQADANAIDLLEFIDNKLSLATATQKEASFAITQKAHIYCEDWNSKRKYFSECLGTSFEHYWFQKLEYILWKKLNKESSTLSKEEATKFKQYRITSKNSVEHVHPQNEIYQNKLENKSLDSFGNLVLLTTSENSTYSNKPVNVKKEDFNAKPHFDSLKLNDIFSSLKDGQAWDEKMIESHRLKMLSFFDEHYNKSYSGLPFE